MGPGGDDSPIRSWTQIVFHLLFCNKQPKSLYEQALEAYSKSLDVKVKVLGQDSPDVADTKYNMAILHKKRGESKVAKQLWLECQAIYAKVFGADHSKTTNAAQQARDCA